MYPRAFDTDLWVIMTAGWFVGARRALFGVLQPRPETIDETDIVFLVLQLFGEPKKCFTLLSFFTRVKFQRRELQFNERFC